MSLWKDLKENAYQFDLFQLIELCEKPGVPLGDGNDPGLESLSIKVQTSLAVKSSPISQIIIEDKTVLFVNVYSLAGLFGPLPMPYTEILLECNREKDFHFQDFLNIFHHRILSLRHKIEKKFGVGLSQIPLKLNKISTMIRPLIGDTHAHQLPHDLQSFFIYHHDLFWKRQRSLAGFQRFLSNFFKGLCVLVIPFQGGWSVAPHSEISFIGIQKGQYQQLGISMILGAKTWDQMNGLLIDLGTLSWNQFSHFFLNHARTKEILKTACLTYLGFEYHVDLKGQLSDLDLPKWRFDRRLGFDMCLRTKPYIKPLKIQKFKFNIC